MQFSVRYLMELKSRIPINKNVKKNRNDQIKELSKTLDYGL